MLYDISNVQLSFMFLNGKAEQIKSICAINVKAKKKGDNLTIFLTLAQLLLLI